MVIDHSSSRTGVNVDHESLPGTIGEIGVVMVEGEVGSGAQWKIGDDVPRGDGKHAPLHVSRVDELHFFDEALPPEKGCRDHSVEVVSGQEAVLPFHGNRMLTDGAVGDKGRLATV